MSQANMIASLCGLRMCMDGVVSEMDLHLSYVPLAHVLERSTAGEKMAVSAALQLTSTASSEDDFGSSHSGGAWSMQPSRGL